MWHAVARYGTMVALLVDGVVGLSRDGCKPPSTRDPHQTKVQVWNNVLSPAIQSALHGTARTRGLGHRVFVRNIGSGILKGNIIEESLDAILTELNDTSEYVEYWTRQEWRSIHAHADVDEFLARRQMQDAEGGGFRYPVCGHVLYLKIGSQVRGPTCIFPGLRSGGDLVCRNDSCYPKAHNVELITVPAMPGRLLRFQGDFLHAVPRPADLWLMNFVQGAPTFEPEEEWGRSVVLFNTWGNTPPAEVPVDDCSNVSSVSDASFLRGTRERCNNFSQWELAYHSTVSTEWTEEAAGSSTNDRQYVTAKIWLLGDYRRRGHQMQTVKLKATESLREALFKTEIVSSVMLERV